MFQMLFLVVIIGLYTAEILETKEQPSYLSKQPIDQKRSIRVSLYNFGQTQFYIVGYLDGKPFNLLIDNGSVVNWVESNNCALCRSFSRKIDLRSDRTLMPQFDVVNYMSGQIEGFYFGIGLQFQSIDSQNIKLKDIEFLVVENSKGMDQLQPDGLLGLGYNKGHNQLIEHLYQQELISERSYSVILNGIDLESSELVFGPHELKTSVSTNIIEVQAIEGHKLWSFKSQSIQLNNEKSFIYETNVSIDIGTSGLILPTTLFNMVVQELEKYNILCKKIDRHLECLFINIFGIFRPVTIIILLPNNAEIVIATDDLFKEFEGEEYGTHYMIDIMPTDEDKIILGVDFLKQYAVTFNYEQSLMRLNRIRTVSQLSMKNMRVEINFLNLIFILLLSLIIGHFMSIGIKALQEAGTNVNYFEIGIFD